MAAARLGRQGVMSFLLQDEMMTTAYPNLLQRTVGLNPLLSPEDGIRKVASAPVPPLTLQYLALPHILRRFWRCALHTGRRGP